MHKLTSNGDDLTDDSDPTGKMAFAEYEKARIVAKPKVGRVCKPGAAP